jgi:bud site selection protein 20
MGTHVLILYRLRALRSEPYTQKEAEAAVGFRTDNGTRSAEVAAPSGEQPVVMEVEDTSSR